MSEEEIMKNLNNVLEKWQEIIKMEDEQEREIEMSMYFEEMPFYEIQGLLGLYNKEKEKNQELKVLIEQNLKYSHNLEKDLFENCSNYIVSKNKIKEWLIELDNMKVDGEVFTTAVNFAKRILQEILNEGE